MSVFFHSSESTINIEVGEYQEFPRPEPAEEPAEEPAKEPTAEPKSRHLIVVLLSFGLLCVLQAILNIALRLSAPELPDGGVTEEGGCPQDWMMFGPSCYYISSQRGNWDSGRRYCVEKEADLVVIDTRQEQDFLTGFAMAAWVGLTDREKEGTWIWVDGSPVNKDSLLWARGQPDGAFGGEDCGDLRTMIDFIGLNDFNCSARNQWICEKKLTAA